MILALLKICWKWSDPVSRHPVISGILVIVIITTSQCVKTITIDKFPKNKLMQSNYIDSIEKKIEKPYQILSSDKISNKANLLQPNLTNKFDLIATQSLWKATFEKTSEKRGETAVKLAWFSLGSRNFTDAKSYMNIALTHNPTNWIYLSASVFIDAFNDILSLSAYGILPICSQAFEKVIAGVNKAEQYYPENHSSNEFYILWANLRSIKAISLSVMNQP